MEVENQNLNQEEETRKKESYEVLAVGENAYPTSAFDYYDMSAQDLSVFDKLEQFAQNITICGVAAYAAYYFYKKVVTPFLYPESKPKTTIERIQELRESFTTSIDEIKSDMAKVETEFTEVETDVQNIGTKIHYMNVDLTRLCYKMNFQDESSDNSTTTIPAWQIAMGAESD